MTPVQASAIPLFSRTKDVVVEVRLTLTLGLHVERIMDATFCFFFFFLETKLRRNEVGALVIAPTRFVHFYFFVV